MRFFLSVLFLVVAIGLTPYSQAQGETGGYIYRTLNHPVPGGIAVLQLGPGTEGPAPVVQYQDQRVMVVKDSDNQWIALVGIDLKTSDGTQRASVRSGNKAHDVEFVVKGKTYPEQRITLKSQKYVEPDPAQLKRFEREYQAQMRAYANFREVPQSNVILDAPVSGRLSSRFGLRRFFNGQERNPHSGLDFAVPAGTPIKAPADGVVTIVDDYFFNGKTVFVDHGQGLITMYCHLSEALVEVGQTVKRGDIIARVGATGRATGPHLHWNVSLNNVRVDPAIFIGKFEP